MKEEGDVILALPEFPDRIVAKILDLIVRTSLKNIKNSGKMYFEYSALIANQSEYLKPFTENVKIATDLQYLQKRTIGNYILRLRLEYIASKLILTDRSVPELLSQIHYQNTHTLSRAFKSYFNCSIPEFRKKHSKGCPEGKNPIRVELSLEKVRDMRIAYLKLERTNNINPSFSVLWKQLLQFSKNYELSSKGCKYVSLTLDYAFITLEEHNRFRVGVTFPPSFKAPKGFGIYEIPSGEYAIFRFKGLYRELHRAYRHIYLD